MSKKSNVLTRDEREAMELLNKLTKKARNELSEFWDANHNQFKQNKVALKEVLKKAIREDKNGDKEEMFNFFWTKIQEVKNQQRAKKNPKGLEINESFINELVVVATLSGNYRYIENLGEKIGYERLINNGKTYRVMLEADSAVQIPPPMNGSCKSCLYPNAVAASVRLSGSTVRSSRRPVAVTPSPCPKSAIARSNHALRKSFGAR